MPNAIQPILKTLQIILPTSKALAHCDVPCGIYDPYQAIIGALTVIRMTDIMLDTMEHINEARQKQEQDLEFRNNLIRAVSVKENHAELVKSEIRTIWGDFFKQEHREQNPNLDNITYKIMQLASKCKQTVNRDVALELLATVNEFATIFWKVKGVNTKLVKSPYKPEVDIVYPILG